MIKKLLLKILIFNQSFNIQLENVNPYNITKILVVSCYSIFYLYQSTQNSIELNKFKSNNTPNEEKARIRLKYKEKKPSSYFNNFAPNDDNDDKVIYKLQNKNFDLTIHVLIGGFITYYGSKIPIYMLQNLLS